MARARRGRAEAADVRVRRARGPAARRGRVAARIPWRRLGTAAAFWLDPARLAFLAFLFALVAGPEMRGLYFPFQLMEATVLVVAALGVFLWRRDRERETARRATGGAAPWWAPWGRFEAAAAAFAGLYLLSGVWAADTQAALWVALLYILSLAGLAFVTQLDPVRRGLVLRAGVAAGSLVAFLGFAAAAGDLPRAHGFTSGTRILSALQYPNTTAAYLVVCLTLALGLAARGPGRPAKGALLGALAGAMVAVFIYTQSRGALLVLPLALLMLWAAAPKGERLRLVMHAMAALLAGGLGALVLSRFWNPSTLSEPHRPGVWLALAVALAAGAALGALAGWLHRRPGPAGLAATLGLAALGLAGGVAAFATGRIPADLLHRFRDISLSTHSVASRLAFNRDAFAIVRDHPFIGVGGGGWNAVYHAYQSFAYSSTQVHDDFMQVWVETGTLGLALFLSLWAVVVIRLWGLWRAKPSAEGVVAGVAALALGLHSAIDFNLSLAAVNLLLWCLWGLVLADWRAVRLGLATTGEGRAAAGPAAAVVPLALAARHRARRRYLRPVLDRPAGWPAFAFYAAASAVVLGTLVLMLGVASGDAAARALQAGDFARAQRGFQRAIAADPFQASFRMDYGQALWLGAGGGGEGQAAQGLAAMATAVAMTPWDANLHGLYGTYLLRSGDVVRGFAEVKRALALNPAEVRRYEALANASVQIAMAYVDAGQAEKAKPYLEEALGLPERLRAEHEAQPEWAGAERTPASSVRLDALVGEAYAMLGDYAKAEPLLTEAARAQKSVIPDDQKGPVYLWLGEVQKAAGKAEAADASLAQARKLIGDAYADQEARVAKWVGGVK